jgi:poly-beta-1,6-N-acetyl-D-glucosamine biosynthesis protein PgaD
MEESGSRAAYPEIIDRQDLKSSSRMLLESFITVAFWTGYAYLLVPFVTLCLWLFGVHISYTEMIGDQGLAEFVRIIRSGGILVFFITIMILGWSCYNYLLFRFRGERRNSRVMICYDEDFSALYHLDLETLQEAKKQSRLVVSLYGGCIRVHPAKGPELLAKEPKLAEAQGFQGK